jgi:hypothetical protein
MDNVLRIEASNGVVHVYYKAPGSTGQIHGIKADESILRRHSFDHLIIYRLTFTMAFTLAASKVAVMAPVSKTNAVSSKNASVRVGISNNKASTAFMVWVRCLLIHALVRTREGLSPGMVPIGDRLTRPAALAS